MEWTRDWPDREGWYWFWGERFKGNRDDAELCAVKVVKFGNEITCIADGHFLYKGDVGECFFTIMHTPTDFPKVEIDYGTE